MPNLIPIGNRETSPLSNSIFPLPSASILFTDATQLDRQVIFITHISSTAIARWSRVWIPGENISTKEYSGENKSINKNISYLAGRGIKDYIFDNDNIYYWESKIKESKTCSEIISVFKFMNMEKIADRLDFLNNLVHEEPNEPEIVFESLREMALFIVDLALPKPMIGLTEDGFIQIQWHITHNGLLAMNFLPSKQIELVAIHPESEESSKQKIINKISLMENISDDISSLIPLLTPQ